MRSLLLFPCVFLLSCAAAQTVLPEPVTLPTDPDFARVVLLGDSGIYDETTEPCDPLSEAAHISSSCRDALLSSVREEQAHAVLVLGDLVYELGPECPETGLEQEQRELLEDLIGTIETVSEAPVVLAIGNHDVHHSTSGKAAAERCYLAYAEEREGVYFPERNFIVELGPVQVAVLDTNRKLKRELADQINEAVDGRDAPWSMFAAHHVWRTYYDKEGQDHGPRFAARIGLDPDLWLNGHAHFLQLGVYDGVGAVTSGSAGKLRLYPGCGGELPDCENEGQRFGLSRYGYAVVDVTPDTVRVVFKDVEGEVLYGWERTADDAEGVEVEE